LPKSSLSAADDFLPRPFDRDFVVVDFAREALPPERVEVLRARAGAGGSGATGVAAIRLRGRRAVARPSS
jgi:hypothetical protein